MAQDQKPTFGGGRNPEAEFLTRLATQRAELKAGAITEWKRSNRAAGFAADALGALDDFARAPFGFKNPPAQIVSDIVGVPSLRKTLERMSYGQPLTNARQANVPLLKPETADALMMAPVSPRNALAAASLGLGMADSGAMRAATVWHGTPHKFDKFDASKIGTGEGAQAYGHGLYLAESQATGQSYKDTLRGLRTNTKDVVGDLMPDRHFTTKERAEIFKAAMEEGKPVEVAARQLGYRQASIRDVPDDVLRQAVERVREQGQGYLYKVDLPDDQIAKMLDWDKPLSQQADKLGMLSDAELYNFGITRDGLDAFTGQPLTGGDLMKFSDNQHGGGWLGNKGIPGLRYLDGGSRGAGKGSSNFVVFPKNEGLLTILERNGQPLK